jgi:hypothetical protein
MEGGVAVPAPDSDLGGDHTLIFNEGNGIGAETGYEVGIRFRHFPTRHLGVSASFHYDDFGDYLAVNGPGGYPVTVKTSILRYGADMHLYLGGPRNIMRPFLTGGASLTRNRYEDETEDPVAAGIYKTSINTLGLSYGIGARFGDLEFTVIYNYNRFKTVRLTGSATKEQYNWDYIVFRAAFAFPTQ